jgi:hypothetical protein
MCGSSRGLMVAWGVVRRLVVFVAVAVATAVATSLWLGVSP